MNNCHPQILLFVLGCLLFLVFPASGQTAAGPATALTSARESVYKRSGQELYEEANGYLGRRYAEFNKQKLGYDAKLEAKTKQEQKELALANSAILSRRKDLSEDDLYYLGMLGHLVGDSEATLKVMRRYLARNSSGDKSQIARAVVVLHATRSNALAEAEGTVAAYRKREPIDFNELFGMETLLTEAFSKAGDFPRTEAHARAMLEVARNETAAKKAGTFKRDERLYKAASQLAEVLLKTDRREEATETITGAVTVLLIG